MSVKFRKSMKVAPGVRVNIGKKSASVSMGGKGFHRTVSTTGRRTTTMGVPGTGLYHVSSSSCRGGKHGATPAGAVPSRSAKANRAYGILFLVLAVLFIPMALFLWPLFICTVLCGFLGVHYLRLAKKTKDAKKPEA